ncbi:restriction endonuclease subunit S [Nitrosopumilus sp.]|nr:restriction endonuclease subunit S [Nitrosopumilus sp.]
MKSNTILKNLIDIKHGFAFKGEFFKEYETKNILLTPGNFLIGGGFNNKKLKFYDGPLYEDYILQENDLIVTLTDLSKSGDTLGFPAYVPKDENHVFLHNQRIGKITIKEPKKILKKFLYYVLCHSDYRNEVLASSTGSTVKHTSPERILSFEFALPELSKQEQISKTLSDLENKIQNLQNQNHILEQIVQTIFKSWFVDFDGVTEWEDSELGKIPKGCKVKKIQEFCDTFGGGTPSTKIQEFWNGDINWAIPSDLTKINNVFLYDTKRKITETGLEKCSSKLHSKNCILMTSRASIGFFAINQLPTATNQGFIVIKPKNIHDLYYLFFNFKNRKNEFIRRANGTTFLEISRTTFRNLLILAPNEKSLKKFHQLTEPLFSTIDNNLSSIFNLTKTRDILLPKLMSGEIRV